MTPGGRVLLVVNPDPTHVGAHLIDAAASLGLDARVCDVEAAYRGATWRRKAEWWLRGHRPARLREFSATVVAAAQDFRPEHLVATGLAPLDVDALDAIGAMGVRRFNFLTDDPWNPAHRASWFMRALARYDRVITPRRANMADLVSLGGPKVSYLPFAYAPARHFPDPPVTADDRARFAADLVFAGGADADRVRAIRPLVEQGFDVALYGGYWEDYRATRRHARGFLDAGGLRKAVAGAKVALCLVRQANRDGHSMRTFEVAAMGGCMLAEDTAEHREILGDAGIAATYFSEPEQAARELRRLLAAPDERDRLVSSSLARIRRGTHTYAARLESMLQESEAA
jgi:hypothetical protein